MENWKLYHGSQVVVDAPSLDKARSHNDYGRGFYTTPHWDLACEWACQKGSDGFVNSYALDPQGLTVLDLLDGTHTTLEWIALLLANRRFDLRLPTAAAAREQLVARFMPSIASADVVIGYRADDSYFSFARAFVENTLPLGILDEAMRLGDLGEQVVLVSEEAFCKLSFTGYESVSSRVYYPRFVTRDSRARNEYQHLAASTSRSLNDLYVIDILREEMGPNDPRIQQHVPCRR
ncbi:MAG: DUF3990 domain-containing protein [Coriobacteriales bacterium]|nr:DUF3990 domain-containing protein [Coriobacteriales bacterium]